MQQNRYEPIIPGVTTRMVVTAAEVINTAWIFCIGMTYILVYIKSIDEYHLWDPQMDFVSIFLNNRICKHYNETRQWCHSRSKGTKPVHSTSIIKRCYFIQNRIRHSLASRWSYQIPVAPTFGRHKVGPKC